MNKLLVLLETTNLIEFFLDEVLDSLHIMVGHLLDVLHTLCFCGSEVAIDIAELVEQFMVEIFQLRQRQFTKGDEILYLDTHTIPNQRIF